MEYDRTEERYKGLAEKILENSNWKDKETLELFKYFVDYCIPAVTSASTKSRLVHEILSDITTVAEEAFAFLVLENNIDRWVWLAKKELQKTTDPEEASSFSTVEDSELPIPNLLYQKKVNITDSSGHKMPAGEWTEKGMKRYNQILRCVMKSRKQKGRIDCEDEMLKLYQKDDDDDIEYLGSDHTGARKQGQVHNGDNGEDTRKKMKMTEVVIDLFNADDME